MSLTVIFLNFLKLGCYAFGGPTAHIAFFHDEFVKNKKWIEDEQFVELIGLTQFLPGPGSSQLGMAIGYHLAKPKQAILGSLVAFLGFTLPAMTLMIFAALIVRHRWVDMSWLEGLKVFAIVVVFDAVKAMIRTCCKTQALQLIGMTSAIIALVVQGLLGQLLVLVLAVFFGLSPYASKAVGLRCSSWTFSPFILHRKTKLFILSFMICLMILPVLSSLDENFKIFGSYYRAGAFVFGGGHVVLPLLWEDGFIQSVITKETFLSGYSLAQGVPGPMFTLASFLGVSIEGDAGGVRGGLISTLAIFLPGWLLLMAVLPVWKIWRENERLRIVIAIISAATTGLLGSAFISPVLLSGMLSPLSGVSALVLWMMKNYLKTPVFLLVFFAFLAGLFL